MNLILSSRRRLYISYLYFFFGSLVLFISTTLVGQTTLKGIVSSNEDDVPIVSAQVIVYSTNGEEIIATAITDSNGKYQLSIDGFKEVKLEAIALFYTKQSKLLYLQDGELLENIELMPKAFELNEVSIKAKRPMVVKKDTVTYDADFYARGDEVVAEDLLRAIPGVDVSSDGKITVNGREVEKVMVDNDDFFEKGYRTMTKSLRAALIEEVEVLDHYSNMSLLKGFEQSDKVALNLKLKPTVKLQTFGDLIGEGDIANPGDFSGHVDLINLKGTSKYYSLLTANNLGNPPIDALGNLWKSPLPTENSLISYEEQISPLASVRVMQPSFRFNRTVANEAVATSISNIIHLNEKITLRPLIAGVVDNRFADVEQFESLKIGEALTIDNLRGNQVANYGRQIMGRLDIYANLHENTHLTSRTSFRAEKQDIKNKLSLNEVVNDEFLDNRFQTFNQRLTCLRKLNSKLAWLFTAYCGWETTPQHYSIFNNPFLPVLSSQVEQNGLTQISRSTRPHLQLESHLFLREDEKLERSLELVVGAKANQHNLFHELIASRETNQGLEPSRVSSNSVSLNNQESYLAGIFNRQQGKLTYQLKAGLHFFHSSRLDSSDIRLDYRRIFLLPTLTLKYRLGKKELFSFNASRQVKTPSLVSVLPFAYINNNGSIRSGDANIQQLPHYQTSLVHTHGNFTDRFTLNNIISFRYDHQYLSESTDIFDDFIYQETLRLQGRKVLQISSSTSQYFPGLRNSLKVLVSGSMMSFADEIQRQATRREITSRVGTGGVELRSAFRGSVNYHLGYSHTLSSFAGVAGSAYEEKRLFADLSVRASTRLKAGLVFESYVFRNENTLPTQLWLLDGSCSYTLKNKKIVFTLLLRNLLDQQTFQTVSNSPLFTTRTRYDLLPRSIRVGARLLL